jgi:hypothetical protein
MPGWVREGITGSAELTEVPSPTFGLVIPANAGIQSKLGVRYSKFVFIFWLTTAHKPQNLYVNLTRKLRPS